MGFASAQVTVSNVTATPLFGTSATGLIRTTGAVSDPFAAIIQNTDGSNTVFLGGPGVTSGNGFPLIKGASIPFAFLGTDATGLYGIANVAPVVVAVLAGRQ